LVFAEGVELIALSIHFFGYEISGKEEKISKKKEGAYNK
jgi:hypothetical protein